MAAERLVVVGGDAAGMSAASQARRLRGPEELSIVAFERGDFTSYSACGIPYWVSGDVEGPEALVARTPRSTGPGPSICAPVPRSRRSTSPGTVYGRWTATAARPGGRATTSW